MPLLVTSAAGANGDGYGALLAFDEDGKPALERTDLAPGPSCEVGSC